MFIGMNALQMDLMLLNCRPRRWPPAPACLRCIS